MEAEKNGMSLFNVYIKKWTWLTVQPNMEHRLRMLRTHDDE